MSIFNKINENELFETLKKKTERIRDVDIEKVLRKEEALESKFLGDTGLREYINQAKQMMTMVKAYWRGEYRDTPRYTIAAIVAALLYVLTPLDLLPDFIPGVGLIDDALMLTICYRWVKKDLLTFEEWRFKQAKWIDSEQQSDDISS